MCCVVRWLAFLVAALAAVPLANAASSGGVAVTPQEAIGWKLFFETALSRPKNFSCATCHVPSLGFEDGKRFGKGAHGDTLPRNTPTVVNLAENGLFFWDGRAGSLEEQASGPITNPIEMDLTMEEAAERVRAMPEYRKAFTAAGVSEITADAITSAIAAFERRLVTGETVFDRWMEGDRSVLNEAQERGRMIFFTKGNCALCHIGANFTDNDFHNIGTGDDKDLGRYAVTGDERDKGLFKTPSLRNWKGREPFMHDGRFATMREVIDYYSDLPQKGTAGEVEITPVRLSEEEKDDVLEFLETLNGAWPDLTPFEAAWKKLVAD